MAATEQKYLANHVDGYAASFDQDFLDLWLMDVPLNATVAVNDQQLAQQLISENPDRDVRHWPFGDKLAHWLEYPVTVNFDLWADKYRPKVNALGWRSFVFSLSVFVLAMTVKLGYDSYLYFSLHSEIEHISEQRQEIVKEVLPEIDFINKLASGVW